VSKSEEQDIVETIGRMIEIEGVDFFDESLSFEDFEKAWTDAGGTEE
jgi:hypothetical protein